MALKATNKIEIDPKDYETLFVSRQVRGKKGRKLIPGKPIKGADEDEYKALRNLRVLCTEKEGKAHAKRLAKEAEQREASRPMPFATGGDVSNAAIAECKKVTSDAVARCEVATANMEEYLAAFKEANDAAHAGYDEFREETETRLASIVDQAASVKPAGK